MFYQQQSPKIPKKITEKLNKFTYYISTLFSNTSSIQQNLQSNPISSLNQLQTKQSNNNKIIYNYLHSECVNTAIIDEKSILSSVKKLYLNQDVVKIDQLSYSRESVMKQAYLPVYGEFSEIIQFVLIVGGSHMAKHTPMNNTCENMQKPKPSPSMHDTCNSKLKADHSIPDHKKSLKPSPHHTTQYSLYVIHNCNSFNSKHNEETHRISWEYFIQRYAFNVQSSQKENKIKYELIYSWFEGKLTQEFIKMHCKVYNGSLENLEKLQGYLLQNSSEVQKNKKIQEDIAFSDQHRRQGKIPAQYYKNYLSLKKQVYKKYHEINSTPSEQKQINKYFYQNLICRYLIAKQYRFQQAKACILEYLRWQKQMLDKYPTLQSFRQIHELGAYRFIGEDFMGRPVVLSKGALVDLNSTDMQKYCDYYIYFLEIYLRQKMRGYIDQMIVIGDLCNLGTKNFKLTITKRNLGDSLKYGPERQYALITVNVSTFAYTAWTFIKPLMPKKTLNKIQIVGHDKKEIFDTLTKRMDVSVVPGYLGGQNGNFDEPSDRGDQKEEFQDTRKYHVLSNNIANESLSVYQAVTPRQTQAKCVNFTTKSSSNGTFGNLFESVSDFMKVFKK